MAGLKKKQAKGTTKKHAGTSKHHHAAAHAKHHPAHQKHQGAGHHPHAKVHAKAKHPHHAKAHALSLGDVACCTADALAASLRLAGWPVGADDILTLHRLTAASPDAGAPIWRTLEAAYAYGLAGVRPVDFLPVSDLDMPGPLLLGVELPGPHAVCADGGTWWSWGERWCPCCFPDAVIEEAW